MIETVRWDGDALWVLDQTKLPFEVHYVRCSDVESVAESITKMLVRGAPAIGVTAAFGMVLAAKDIQKKSGDFPEGLRQAGALLAQTRPTAVNLFWAIEKMHVCAKQGGDAEIVERMEKTALEIYEDDISSCKAIGRFGAQLIPDQATILTHCNAGALATAGYGTALGVIRGAVAAGKKIKVISGETRPYLQGARLTVWELLQDNIDTTLITDNMSAYLMARGEIDAVVVGADRIAANGDTANKIGTYAIALAAAAHDIPFYIAAPVSTIDPGIPDGSRIPIEERAAEEVTHVRGVHIAAPGVKVRNPAFDVTPAHLIRAIITDKGILYPPYSRAIADLLQG